MDWKRKVSALYQAVRTSPEPAAAWISWRAARDDLFRRHPQSPVPERNRARLTVSYYPYDPAARVLAEVTAVPPVSRHVTASDGGTYQFTRFADARFALFGRSCALGLYWLEGYGGGLFVPFRDATSGAETYGGGRYLLDTVKGADLGVREGRLVLDFNFAYNPSCAYDSRWSCPLAPPENHLRVAVRAGERAPGASAKEATDV
ncbi:MAG TPA: DUF1684 domain-containing protein [bacterium]|nr:DUF1684 domain-containing protein [bacterium]